MGRSKIEPMKWVFAAAACVSILAVLLICAFLFVNGVGTMSEIGFGDYLLGKVWRPSQELYGILAMVVGSLYVTAGAIIIGVPFGILCAIFLTYYCPEKMYKVMKPAVNLMAGIPSIVYGFFGLVVLVPLVQQFFGGSGKSILAASIMLGIMILPTIVNLSESAMRALPGSYMEGALALGATKERSIFFVLLPAAKSGVMAGVVLGIGRAIGEAMVVSMVAGNQSIMPGSFLDGAKTLTSGIVLEMGYAQDLHKEALIANATVLFVFILLINVLFNLVKKEKAK